MEQLNNLLKDLRLKYDQLESMKASALFIQDKHIIMSEQKGILFSMEQITKLIESMSSLPNITEYSAFNLFDAKYGRDLKTRFAKIEEEFFELKKEVEKISDNPDENLIIRIKDETCDLNACVGHFASILKLYQHEMLHYVVDKIKGREKDPNYKRFSVSDKLDVVVKYPTEFDKVENYKDSDGYKEHLLSEGDSKENPIQPIQLIMNPNYKRFNLDDGITLDVSTDFMEVLSDDNLKVSVKDLPPSLHFTTDPDSVKCKAIAAIIDFSSEDKHPIAILIKDIGWVKPDPEFYYDKQHIKDAWKNYSKGNEFKMIKCNPDGTYKTE